LGHAAMQIGKVVETITEISEQVNLLALNATIEAARAGDAGKGFAVVANEIKELAKQTAAASGEIKQQIQGIQTSTQGTVTEIGSIAKVVGEVNELVTTIAAAVEEQSVTTKDIAGNVARASEGVGEVNTTIAEGSNAANSIAADIADVTQAADEMTNASSQVNASSGALLDLAEKLNVMVKQFRV
jgi:methyl-accepting chemotaxis protein